MSVENSQMSPDTATLEKFTISYTEQLHRAATQSSHTEQPHGAATQSSHTEQPHRDLTDEHQFVSHVIMSCQSSAVTVTAFPNSGPITTITYKVIVFFGNDGQTTK